MKTRVILAMTSLLTGVTGAHVLVPGQGRSFDRRQGGDANSGGVTIVPADGAQKPKTSYKTFLVLADSRAWTSSDGKVIQAKLIAVEDVVVDESKPEEKANAAPPANPTVVRGGKVRLLLNQKPVELAVDRLVQADRDFIEKIRVQHAKKTPASH